MNLINAFSIVLKLLAVLMFLLAAFIQKAPSDPDKPLRSALLPIGLALLAFSELVERVIPPPA